VRAPYLSRQALLAGSTASVACQLLSQRPVLAQANAVLKIGNSGLEAQAQAFYAEDQGLFKKNFLDVEIVVQRGGAATVAAVAGGALQIGCANVISLGQALQRKLPFVILTTSAIWDTKHPSAYAVVAPDSPIKSAKELNDKLFMMAFIKQSGGDPSTVKFVEVPEGAATEALAQGRIAAFILNEPVFTSVGRRVRSLGAAPDAIAPFFAQTAWFTTEGWLSQNKDIARRFIAAVIDGGKWAMANRTAAAGVLERRLGFKEARTVIDYAVSADPSLVQVFYDRAAEYKMLPPLRAADFFWNGK
jgi:NitT/TauT family transport system substrate-binding protein